MLARLAAVAVPLLLVQSVSGAVFGKVDVVTEDGEPNGCMGPNAMWTMDGNCATYKATRSNFGGEGGNYYVWELMQPDSWGCNGHQNPMRCTQWMIGKSIYHGKHLEDGAVLNYTKWYASAEAQECGLAQLWSKPSPEVTTFEIFMKWREVPDPSLSAEQAAITEKPSPVVAACTSTSTVPATTTNPMPHPWYSPAGVANIQYGGLAGCLTKTGMWTKDRSRCAIYHATPLDNGFTLKANKNDCFLQHQAEGNHSMFKCAPNSADKALKFTSRNRMLLNPIHPEVSGYENWATSHEAEEGKDTHIFADFNHETRALYVKYQYLDNDSSA